VKVKREETHDVVVMGFAEAKQESVKVDGSVSATKYAGGVGAIRFGQYKRAGTTGEAHPAHGLRSTSAARARASTTPRAPT
jgi:hypothetical protein